jgi:hypothetical protein
LSGRNINFDVGFRIFDFGFSLKISDVGCLISDLNNFK